MAFENVPQMMSRTKFWLDFESISFRLYYACRDQFKGLSAKFNWRIYNL